MLARPAVAIGIAGVLATAGAVGIATSPALRALGAARRAAAAGLFDTVRTPGMPRILVSGSALMLGFGALETAVPAFATAAGRPGLSGVLLAVWSLGSALGGLWFGARVRARLAAAAVPLGAARRDASACCRWPPSPARGLLGALLFLGGTAIAPTLTVQSNLVGAIAPAHATTEAFTWLSTIAFGASAVGAAVGGALIDGSAGPAARCVLAALGRRSPSALTLVPGRRPHPAPTERSSPSPPESALSAVIIGSVPLATPSDGVSCGTTDDHGGGARRRARPLVVFGSVVRGSSGPRRLRLVRSMAPHC